MKKIYLVISIIGLTLGFSTTAAAQQMFDYNKDGDVSVKGRLRPANGASQTLRVNNSTARNTQNNRSNGRRNQQQSLIVTTSDIEAYNRQNAFNARGLTKIGAGTLPVAQNSVVFEPNSEPLWANVNRKNPHAPRNSSRNRQQNVSRSGNRRRP